MNIDPYEWVLLTPYGPMQHRDTGETYQGRQARLEHEHQLQQAAQQETAPAGRRQFVEE